MAFTPEEKEDVVFSFHEGMDVYGLDSNDSMIRLSANLSLSLGMVRDFLQEDRRLTKDDLTAQNWDQDRAEDSLYCPDWEWYVSLLIQKGQLEGDALVAAVSRAFQISPETARAELKDLSFLEH